MTFDLVYHIFASKIAFLTQHDGVDDESYDVLRDEEGDGSRTLFRYHPPTESDGHLNLDGEQEGGRKWPENEHRFKLPTCGSKL